MECVSLTLPGLKYIYPKIFPDERGFFLESFHADRYAKEGVEGPFVQDNHSYSTRGCLRGMHFQSFPGQGKLIRVGSGTIFDVAVDLRPQSPTFGRWEGVILDSQDHAQLWIPVGFAHGFCVLSQEAHVLYKVTSPYNPATEKGFRWDDPQIGIDWPISHPIVSERDQKAPLFSQIFSTTRGMS